MSAYVVDRNHIRFLVAAAERLSNHRFSWWSKAKGCRLHLHPEDMTVDQFGQMLWDENISSIVARYPDCKAEDGTLLYDRMPGTVDEVYLYQHPMALGWTHIDPVVVLKACGCYRYQSCKHQGWEKSEACAAIQALEYTAIGCLPGWSKASWGKPTSQAVSIFSL